MNIRNMIFQPLKYKMLLAEYKKHGKFLILQNIMRESVKVRLSYHNIFNYIRTTFQRFLMAKELLWQNQRTSLCHGIIQSSRIGSSMNPVKLKC